MRLIVQKNTVLKCYIALGSVRLRLQYKGVLMIIVFFTLSLFVLIPQQCLIPLHFTLHSFLKVGGTNVSLPPVNMPSQQMTDRPTALISC